jgi:hypothetical protein
LPCAHHGHRPTWVPTHLHAHAITMPSLPRLGRLPSVSVLAPCHFNPGSRFCLASRSKRFSPTAATGPARRPQGQAVPPRARRRPLTRSDQIGERGEPRMAAAG